MTNGAPKAQTSGIVSVHLHSFRPSSSRPKAYVPMCVTVTHLQTPRSSKLISLLPSAAAPSPLLTGNTSQTLPPHHGLPRTLAFTAALSHFIPHSCSLALRTPDRLLCLPYLLPTPKDVSSIGEGLFLHLLPCLARITGAL